MTCIGLAALLFSVPQAPQPPQDSPFRRLNEVRTIDGTGNNLAHPEWGSAGVALVRVAANDYADGISAPAGATRPSPRVVSNLVVAQTQSIENRQRASDFVWQWGQFLDHDLDETPVADPAEEFPIAVPTGDPYFDPLGTGTVTIPLARSLRVLEGGVGQQTNLITAYIDASNVYGSEAERAEALRTHDGTGRLKTSAGDFPPFNTDGLPNAPSNAPTFYLAGDFRANEQVGLLALHTLFVREHNYWADRIAAEGLGGPGGGHHPGHASQHGSRDRRAVPSGASGSSAPAPLTGDEIYELARAIVGAEMQVITYDEFLPLLLGPNRIEPYQGYRPEVNASIRNEFATAAYRFGHSMLSPTLLRLEPNGQSIADGDLSLADAFFNPSELLATGIEPVLRGLATQRAQAVDNHVVDEVRNFLFGPPGAGGFDLASLNLQRGRDHGLASYNETRIAYGLPPMPSFAALSRRPSVQRGLAASYGDVDEVDLWIGALCEEPLPRALVGETLATILAEQFEALRDGDRYWYQHALPPSLIHLVEDQSLARIIERNTTIGSELSADVFRTL